MFRFFFFYFSKKRSFSDTWFIFAPYRYSISNYSSVPNSYRSAPLVPTVDSVFLWGQWALITSAVRLIVVVASSIPIITRVTVIFITHIHVHFPCMGPNENCGHQDLGYEFKTFTWKVVGFIWMTRLYSCSAYLTASPVPPRPAAAWPFQTANTTLDISMTLFPAAK